MQRNQPYFLKDLTCHVNLIHLNEVEERKYKSVSEDKTNRFLRELVKYDVSVTIRRGLGGDIDGACGQLRNRVIENNAGEARAKLTEKVGGKNIKTVKKASKYISSKKSKQHFN